MCANTYKEFYLEYDSLRTEKEKAQQGRVRSLVFIFLNTVTQKNVLKLCISLYIKCHSLS